MFLYHENISSELTLPFDQISLPMWNGDAVSEELRVSGGKILFWEDHYFRLMANLRIMRMEIPMSFTPEHLESEVIRLVSAADSALAYRVNILVWRLPGEASVDFLMQCGAVQNLFYTTEMPLGKVDLFKDHFLPAGLLSSVSTANRAVDVLADVFARENDYGSCLLLNNKKMVLGSKEGSLFLVSGYKIKTPPITDGTQNSVIRKKILEILTELPDYVVETESISPFELQRADELFVATTQEGIRPINQYRKKKYGHQVALELVQKLNVKARLG